jgi:acyl-coenzyme A synthetase/AMP-(fatty) acid ligase
LARRLPDSNLEFIGQVDQQVKLRGFRIELGEIEAVLEQHTGVREAVAMVREDVPGDRRLVAYVVAGNGVEMNMADLRRHAQARLPDYMVPAACVLLEALPLTVNNKMDRGSLPMPDQVRPELDNAHAAPRDTVELQLVQRRVF